MKKLFFPGLLVIFACTAFGQQKIVADKIAGIIGDKIVLRSDLAAAISDFQRQAHQGVTAPDNCEVLDEMLTQKALVLQAEKDSLVVSDDEIDALLDNQVRGFIQMYGSKEALEQIAGRTIYQIKEDFRIPFREKKLAEQMRSKIVDGIKITPTEVKEFYEKIPKENLLFYDVELQLGQIVAYPKASHDIEKLASDELTEYKNQVESGAKKFENLARIYSDDPGSKDKGGEMEISRGDKLDPVFMATAFRLKDGQISGVIKSAFGYHIIQMVKREGDEAIIRHILRIPQITDAETGDAKLKLDSVRDKLVNGQIGFGEAVSKYSDDPSAKFTAGLLMSRDGSTFLTYDQLDKDMVLLLKNSNLKAGEYSKPTVYTDDRGKKGVRIVRLVTKSEPHRENLKDDYDRIAQRALDRKKAEALQKWFNTKISTYFVMIDGEYTNCANLSKWQQKGNASTGN